MNCSHIKISCFFFFVFVHAFLLLSPLVHGADDDENTLLQGINSYRTSLRLPALGKNAKAGCLADRIADDIEDEPCSSLINGASIAPTSQTLLTKLPEHLRKCKIDPNSSSDGVIMPVCVPNKLAPSTLVLTNYTRSPQYARHLNDSRYTGVGLGSDNDWIVVVLATNNPTGSFASGACSSLVSIVGFGHHLVTILLVLALILVC